MDIISIRSYIQPDRTYYVHGLLTLLRRQIFEQGSKDVIADRYVLVVAPHAVGVVGVV